MSIFVHLKLSHRPRRVSGLSEFITTKRLISNNVLFCHIFFKEMDEFLLNIDCLLQDLDFGFS